MVCWRYGMNNNDINLTTLQESLNYLHVGELKDYCSLLLLSTKGKKLAIIARIIHFLKTGEKIEVQKYPAVSCARASKTVTLQPDGLMLKGSYKNDLKTRLFFKNLMGVFSFHRFRDRLARRALDGRQATNLPRVFSNVAKGICFSQRTWQHA